MDIEKFNRQSLKGTKMSYIKETMLFYCRGELCYVLLQKGSIYSLKNTRGKTPKTVLTSGFDKWLPEMHEVSWH